MTEKSTSQTTESDVLVRAKAIYAQGRIDAIKAGELTIRPGIVPDLIAEIERLRAALGIVCRAADQILPPEHDAEFSAIMQEFLP